MGIASGLFASSTHGRVSRLYRRLIELLGSIPSWSNGFWGLVVLTPATRALEPPGQSLLAGILILAIMFLPTSALLAQAGVRSVPRT